MEEDKRKEAEPSDGSTVKGSDSVVYFLLA